MKIVKQNKKTGETVYKEVDIALDELIEKWVFSVFSHVCSYLIMILSKSKNGWTNI
jgi:hypothetical protein